MGRAARGLARVRLGLEALAPDEVAAVLAVALEPPGGLLRRCVVELAVLLGLGVLLLARGLGLVGLGRPTAAAGEQREQQSKGCEPQRHAPDHAIVPRWPTTIGRCEIEWPCSKPR